jgi:hypothetical protein
LPLLIFLWQIAIVIGELSETRSFAASKLTTKQCFNARGSFSSIEAKTSHLRGEQQLFKGESFMLQTQVIWSEGACIAKKVRPQSPQCTTTQHQAFMSSTAGLLACVLRFFIFFIFPFFFHFFLQVGQKGADERQFTGYEEPWSAKIQEYILVHPVCDF